MLKKTDEAKEAKIPMRNEHAAIAALVRVNWDRLTAEEQAALDYYRPDAILPGTTSLSDPSVGG